MAIINVGIGGDIQAAINSAVGGDIIKLNLGGSWTTENYTLPPHSGASMVRITTSGTLPAAGQRVAPADAAQMPYLASPNISPVFECAPGADYWEISGLEIGPGGHVDHIALQLGTHEDPVLANYPVNITVDQCYIHGDPTTGMMKRGVSMHAVNGIITNNYIVDVVSAGSDSQGIWLNGPGPTLVDNNNVQAAGENILVGGADPAVTDMVPTDLTFTNNDISKPHTWFLSNDWSVKNLFELKNASQVVVRYNTFQRCWPDSQPGYAILITPRNQDGTAPWTVVEDVLFELNRVLDVSSAFDVLGDDDEATSQRTNNITIQQNLVVTNSALYGGDGRAFVVLRGPSNLAIEQNTFINDGSIWMALDNPTYIAPGLVIQNNIWQVQDYGIHGDALASGTASLNAYFTGYSMTGNVGGGGDAADYPGGNTFLAMPAFRALFVDYAGGDYRLLDGSPYAGIGVDYNLLDGVDVATKFYLYGTDGIVSPPTTWKGGWNSTPASSSATIAMDPLKDYGPNAARTASEASATNPFSVALFRAVSRPLAAQTISGTLDVLLGILESNADADFYWKVYAYVRVGTTDAIRGVLLNYEDSTVEWPTTSTGTQLPAPQTLSSVVCSENDQIVVEIGYISRNSHSTSRAGTARIGAMTVANGLTELPDLTVGSTATTTTSPYLTFSQAIVLKPLANDLYDNATPLTASFTETIDLTAATRDGDEPEPCNGSPTLAYGRHASAWYEWLCPVDQNASVTAEIVGGLFTFNTVLMVLTGTPGSFVTVGCSAENDPTTETVNFAATAGVTYTIMVATVYTGGGQLTFTFEPDVEPTNAEVTIGLSVDGLMDGDKLTAMDWINLLAPVSNVRHFYYIGNGETPFTDGDPYVWVGTDDDGVTLRLDVFDGATLTTTLGSVLALNTWYHWALVKDGDSFIVYLSTELGDPTNANAAITATVTIPLIPQFQFVYGLEATMIPKSYKTWDAALTRAEIIDERETYAGVRVPDVVNVTQFRTDTRDSVGGLTDYSGWDHRLDPPLAGSPTDGWEVIKGPIMAIQPERTFADNFDSYASGYTVTDPYVPGVVGQAAYWEYPTQPSFKSYIRAAVGINASQAFDSRQTSASLWFEHDGYDGLCGSVSAFSYKVPESIPGNPTSGHGVGVQVYDPIAYIGNTDLIFGIANGQISGATGDLFFFNNYDGTVETISGVYTPDVYQRIVLFFKLSTVAGSQTDVNPDGTVWVQVDGVIRYTRTGLKLTVDDSRWTDDINTWSATSFPWGGYMDNVTVGTECFDVVCPGTRGAPRTGT